MAKKKDDFNKIQHRIKKHPVGNAWLQNVAKSMKVTTFDVVTDLMPNTTDFLQYNTSDTIDMVRSMRTNMGSRQMVNNQFKNIPQIRAANDALKNAMKDLKSGNLNNKAREQEFDFDDMDYGFGMFDENDKLEFIDDETNNKPVTIIDTMPLAKALNNSTEATVTTMINVAEQQMAIESEKLMFNHKSTNSILGGLSAINDNLSMLVKFNADSTAKFHAASLKFYEDTADYINRANTLLKKQEQKEKEELMSKYEDDLFTYTGGVILKRYSKTIKKNIEAIRDENAMLASVFDSLTDPDTLKGLTKNPLGTIMNMTVKHVIPAATQMTVKALDESISSIIPSVLAKINTLDGSDNPLYNIIYKIFGSKNKLSYEVDLGDYEKGAIAWDGESKKALVEVIPTYLRRIESALTGNDERVYNFSTGKFSNVKDIKKNYDSKLNEVESSGYTETKLKMREIARNMKTNKATMDQFEKDMNEYFAAMTKKGSVINPFLTKNEDGIVFDMFEKEGLFDSDPKRATLMRKVMQGLSMSDLRKMATTEIYNSRKNTQRYMDEVRKNPNLSGYATLYNEDADKKIAFNPEKRLGGVSDRFGLTQLDYLRDIRSALINGIKVFPDNLKRYKGWKPNNNLIKKEKEEANLLSNIKTSGAIEEISAIDYNYDEVLGLSKEELDAIYSKTNGRPKDYNKKVFGNVNKAMDTMIDIVDAQVFKILFDENNERTAKGDLALQDLTDKAKNSKAAGLFNSIKSVFTSDKENGKVGLLTRISQDFMDGFEQFKVTLFGEKQDSEKNKKETFNELMNKVKSRIPKAIASGIGAGMVKTAIASNMGILGSLLLPGGPIGAMLIGTSFGFLKQSETFNKWLFGEKTEDGDRTGGFLPSSVTKAYEKYGASVKKGAGIGFLASFLLPGGPITGSLLGVGAAIASKNDVFQEFLFGKDFKEKNKKSLMDGFFGKVFRKNSKKEVGANPKLATFLGGAGLVAGVAQGVGLLPSFLLPGGPIVGSMLGLAAGITASSDKFQEFLFGEKDVDGKRYGGLVTKFTNWFDTSVVTPLKIKATAINDKIYGFLRKKVFDPIIGAFEPIKQAGKFLIEDAKNAIINSFKNVTEPVVNSFREHVTKPLGKMLKTALINPIFRILKGTFSLFAKTVGSVLTSPIKLISGVGNIADRYNERHVLRDIDTRGMSKEEKQEILNNALEYRNGMTRRQRKKAAKKDLKDEMSRRADRRAEMQRQYEEDRAFGKQSGWKFASKSQQEKRERELKDKQAWLQEKMATEAEDTGKKVSKMQSAVEKISEFEDKGVNLLTDIKNSLKDISKAVKGSDTLGDIGKKLRDKGQSHEDGLESVPKDGYIAELHKDEMVLPKKPAGLLRNMFKSGGSLLSKLFKDNKKDRADNALGLSDEEQDQLDELEDRQRYSKASRKSADFVLAERKREQKEKEEKAWKTEILSAIYGVGSKITAGAEKSTDLLGALGNLMNNIPGSIGDLLKGLGITGSLATIAAVMYPQWQEYKNSEEYRESRTDKDGLMVYDNADISMAGKFLHKGTRKAFMKPISLVNDKIIKPIINDGKAVYNTTKEVGGKVVNGTKKVVSKVGKNIDDFINPKVTAQGESFLGTAYKYTGDVVDPSARKGIAKPIGKVLDATKEAKGKASDMIGKFMNMAKEAMQILVVKVTEKYPKVGNFAKSADGVFSKLLKDADDVYKRFSKKIAAFFVDVGLDLTGVGTVAEICATAYDFLTGFTAGNTGNLFGVSPDNVDMEMRGICSLLQTLCKFSFMAVLWIINEMTNSMYGWNFIRDIATAIYKALPKVGKTINLNSTLKGSEVDQMGSIDEVLQKAGVTDTSKYKDKNGNWVDFSKVKLDKNDELSARDLEEVARYQYNQENGTTLDSDAWIDKNSQTFGSKIMGSKWMKNFKGSFQGDSIRGHMGLNKDAKLSFKDRYLYLGGSMLVNGTNHLGKLLHNDKMKNWTTEQLFSGYAEKREEKYNKKISKSEDKIAKLQEKNEKTDSTIKQKWNNMLIKYNEKKIAKAKKKLGTAEKEVKKAEKTLNANSHDKNSTTQQEKINDVDDYLTLGMAEVAKENPEIDKEFGLNDVPNKKELEKASKSKSKSNNKSKSKADEKIEKATDDVSSSVDNTFTKLIKTVKKSGSILVKGMNSNLGIFGKSINVVTGVLSKLTKKTSKDIENDTTKSTKELTKNSKGLIDSVKGTLSTVAGKVKDVVGNIKNINVSPISVDTLNGFFGNVFEKFLDFLGVKKDEEETTKEKEKEKEKSDSSDKDNIFTKGIDKVKSWLNLGSAGSDTITKENKESGFIQTKDNDNYVFYSQSDNRWAKTSIGDKNMSSAGCGPTSLAMAISQVTGEKITPDVIAKYGKDYLPGYSSYGLFPEIAKKFNMNYYDTNNAAEITNSLRNGTPVVLSGKYNGDGESPYTKEGHIVVANKIDGDNVFVSDPRGQKYSRTYKLAELMNGLNRGMVLSPSNQTKLGRYSSGKLHGIDKDNNLFKQPLLYGDSEYTNMMENLGSEGGKVRVADRVLSYARAFLANTSKFKYSQAQNNTTGRYGIDHNNIGADCSSFVSHVLSVAGDAGKIQGLSSSFWTDIGTKVNDPQIGDVVCQEGHVGLYSGDGKYIHMSGHKDGIKESKAIQRGNNKHRGYKRVLKNPNAMVDATITGGNSLLGTVIATESGNPVNGGSTATTDGTTSGGSASAVDQMGVFGKMGNVAQNMMASIFNGKQVDLFSGSDTSTTTTGGSTVDISGESDYATGVWKFLIGKGYSPQAAAGILGNMTQESGVDPTVIQGGGKGPAAGICQWENWRTKSSRWKAMSDYASSKGKDWTDLQSQLEWLDLELQGKDSTTLSKLKSLVGGYEGFKQIKDVNKATEVFEKAFERAGKPNMSRRYSAAQGYYDKFANGGASLNGDNGPVPTATSAQSSPADGSIPTSMNGWAYYKQGDPKWQEDIGGKKIGPSGCGMASHAMMLTSMFGKEISPVEVGKFGRAKGLWSNGMSWTFPSAVAKEFNLDMSPVVEKSNGASNGDLDAVKAVIKNGRPVILSGKGVSKSKSPFTTGGHIVLAVGVDGNNRLIINDPRGPEYTRAYEDSEVMDIGTGLRGAWSFDTNSNSKIPDGWKTGSSFSAGSYSGTSDTSTGGSASTVDQLGAFGKMGNIAQNMMASIFNGKQVDLFGSSSDTTGSTSTVATGTGNFPKYNLNDSQIKGIANILQNEQPGPEGMQAEASLMANLTDMKGDSYATVDNLVKTATGGWFAKGKSRFNNPGSPSQTAIDAVNSVLINGRRTIPRYVNEHDCFSDIEYATNNGSKINVKDRSSYKQFETKIKNVYGATGTFHSFPNSKSDPFYYTSEENRSKWGENCYPPTTTSGDAGMGEGEKVKYNKINTDKGGEATKLLKASQREVEKMSRLANNSLVKAYDDSAINKVCIDMLNVIVEQLQAINSNTADTAKGISDIQIVSANEPVNNTTSPNRTRKTNDTNRQVNSNTGYDIARKIASFK